MAVAPVVDVQQIPPPNIGQRDSPVNTPVGLRAHNQVNERAAAQDEKYMKEWQS
jgi:hypothetical protein